ncbi:MAG: RNA polymerase sigma factor [Saprospiraceae bacterium]|nr:RNA polymerase sigma factor [Saprospiraceae bacterium]MBK9677562.1 RNA polymerase sigma factor [Saprospiraceae bacterium]MBL0110023.1 RNA polymerase sigma factor [Saprospiraceae bacterium]MBP8941320.1 RNA polymerase sigma factor [Saprospiraceae bacterium]
MTDGLLMQKVKEGDLSQASLLFQRYHRRIYLYLGKMAGDYHLAEDLTQNVFEKLILYRKSFELDQNFEGWVYRIAKNVFLDHTKLQNRMRKGSEEELIKAAELPDHQPSLDEAEQKLHTALAALPEQDREVLILTRFQKMKYIEVAALLGTTESNIKVKVYRAMDKLRTQYFQIESI